jgi:hypothetical protein
VFYRECASDTEVILTEIAKRIRQPFAVSSPQICYLTALPSSLLLYLHRDTDFVLPVVHAHG